MITIGQGERQIDRRTLGALDGSYGPDRGKRLVATFEAGDLIAIRPERSRRVEHLSLFDAYRMALRARALREAAEKRARKKAEAGR